VKRWILWVPFLVFAGIALTAAVMLNRSDRTVEEKLEEKVSMLVGKELPDFSLPGALPGRATIARADYGTGGPRVLNIFASWCLPCIEEAPQLMALSRQGMPIDAVAIRDRPEDVARFLGRWGDPYRNIGLDADSSLQLALGSRGVPETFIIDGRGTIRYHKVGPIYANDVARITDEFEKAKQ
jgi:cytochrome c biogenesis protein CcmG/thiol:disulfide interchange protein DsbE